MINRQELIDGRNKYIGKDVVFKSPTRYSNEKAKRKLQTVDVVSKYAYENDITTTYFYGVKVRYGGGSFTVSPHEIISIDGQQFDEYDKDNYSTLIGAYKNRLGL